MDKDCPASITMYRPPRSTVACWMDWPFIFVLALSSLSCVQGFCPSQCQCNDAALETDCSSARLDVVPILLNPALRSLRLAHNRISTIRQSLDFYADLEVLDLSHNALTGLGQRQLESQKVLRWLNLSFNAIGSLDSRGFQGLGQLEVLDLSNNELTSVEDGVLAELEQLAELDLSYNRIERLSDHCFASLSRLRSLDLSNNRLQQLAPSPSWTPLGSSLLLLDLSHNLLAQLDGGEGGLSALAELRQLSLKGNQVHHIHVSAFEGLGRLMELDLSANRLEYVPSDSLSSLGGSLRSLDLSSNYVIQIGAGAFAELVQLETLRMSDISTLQSVHRDALSSLNGSLQTLVLSNNKRWRAVDPHVLASLAAVRYVDLSGNGLESVARVDRWPAHLEYFDLSGNPLQCNCSMHWLWQHQRSSPVVTAANRTTVPMKDIICQGPAPLTGRRFFELEESHLVCWSSATILLIALVSGLVLTVLSGLAGLCCWHRRRRSLSNEKCLPPQHIQQQQQTKQLPTLPPPHHLTMGGKSHLTNNILIQHHHVPHHHHHPHHHESHYQTPDSPPLKSKTLSLPKTVDYYLNDDDYVYHPGGHLVKPIPVTAV